MTAAARLGLRPLGTSPALVAAVVAVPLAVAGLQAVSPAVAAGAALLAVAGVVALVWPLGLALAALPATFAYWRVGGGAVELSVADAALAVAAVAAVAFTPRSAPVSRVLRGAAAYQLLLLACVLATPTPGAVVEWGHRILLVGGSVVVGSALGAHGRAPAALRAFLVASVAIAAVAVFTTATTGFAPAYPLGIHKNAAGPLFMMGLVLAVVAPGSVGLRVRGLTVVRFALLAGLAACQSRGAGLAAVAVLCWWALTTRGNSTRRLGVVAGVLLVLVAVGLTFLRDKPLADDDEFNSYNSRVTTYEAALERFEGSPVLGSGIRFFTQPDWRGNEPHSVVVVTLAETGVVGALALAGLLLTALTTLARLPGPLARAARLVLLGRLLEAMVGIYWVAGTQALSWLVVGLALGAAAQPSPSRVEALTS